MTPSEAELYKDLPVLFHVEEGFFMEPSAETHELKICDEHPGYINPVYGRSSPDAGGDGTSEGERRVVIGFKPFARRQIPLKSEERIRALLRDTMPHLAARSFSLARICWDADTVDRLPLIDWYTASGNGRDDVSDRRDADGDGGSVEGGGRLLLAVGGSGHCFKTMPAMGQVVLELLEGRIDDRTRRAFRWRPEIAQGRDWWDVQGRWGARGEVMDFNKVQGWTGIGED
ncbi:putative fructosyl amine:oxygen oxidoreductase [Rosellinia necatrix]|uniref:Putative fructosyl amine:oxygen oxidoreductase n=1 Tax=Rosellinia necatrix TaxID=77044 RepID=A0A1S8A6Z8_ROSNE|nr:putative fructosyl amine:oxygen oxidoreductase [Rosellinia necatrix]